MGGSRRDPPCYQKRSSYRSALWCLPGISTSSVSRIAADTVQDQKTNTSYYPVRITLPTSEIQRLDNKKLVAGMPVEVFIKTQDRNVLSYLVKPLEDQINRVFKER